MQFIQDFLDIFVGAPGSPRGQISELISDDYLGRANGTPVRSKLNHARHAHGSLDSAFRPFEIGFYFVWVYVPFHYRQNQCNSPLSRWVLLVIAPHLGASSTSTRNRRTQNRSDSEIPESEHTISLVQDFRLCRGKQACVLVITIE